MLLGHRAIEHTSQHSLLKVTDGNGAYQPQVISVCMAAWGGYGRDMLACGLVTIQHISRMAKNACYRRESL